MLYNEIDDRQSGFMLQKNVTVKSKNKKINKLNKSYAHIFNKIPH